MKILVAPLDWGLGHATRCIPIIDQLLEEGNEVVIAATGNCAALLRQRFPKLQMITDIPPYNIRYPAHGMMSMSILLQTPKILSVIQKEHEWLKKVIMEEHIDEVYSDNRYGLYSDTIPCHFITHQLFIRGPKWVMPYLAKKVKSYVDRYTTCRIPDYETSENLSGELSHDGIIPINVEYIGPQSRFSPKAKSQPVTRQYEYFAIISGPEPQRTILEEKLKSILSANAQPSLMVCGKPEASFDKTIGNLRMISHLNDDAFQSAALNSRFIICRSGYSSIMDLHVLGKKAILIPTPGQTEQEYLAEYHTVKKNHVQLKQNTLDTLSLQQAARQIGLVVAHVH